ncbi:MAG: hypothetical protein ACI9J3_004162 [Parvicellaceae bacterium]|jgi:hypothetical protein
MQKNIILLIFIFLAKVVLSQSCFDDLILVKMDLLKDSTTSYVNDETQVTHFLKIDRTDSLRFTSHQNGETICYMQKDSLDIQQGWSVCFIRDKSLLIGVKIDGIPYGTWYYYQYKNKTKVYRTTFNYSLGVLLSVGKRKALKIDLDSSSNAYIGASDMW